MADFKLVRNCHNSKFVFEIFVFLIFLVCFKLRVKRGDKKDKKTQTHTQITKPEFDISNLFSQNKEVGCRVSGLVNFCKGLTYFCWTSHCYADNQSKQLSFPIILKSLLVTPWVGDYVDIEKHENNFLMQMAYLQLILLL